MEENVFLPNINLILVKRTCSPAAIFYFLDPELYKVTPKEIINSLIIRIL